MIKTFLTILALLPGIAYAVICKTIDADGVVGYADVPASECPQQVKLPDYSRYQPRPVQKQDAPAGSQASGSVVQFVRYESISIAQPKTGGVVRSNEGRVTVVIALQPALQPGHRVNLTIDGRAVSGSFDGLAIDLTGVDRGTHTLRASVSDANGRVLISSNPVSFTLRKRGLTDSNPDAEKPEPPPKPDIGYPAPTTPPNYEPPGEPDFGPAPDPDYSPGAGPDYTPTGGGISTTPGQTNPAFAPKYTP